MDKKQVSNALKELRKEKKRNFSQTVDLIVNLKNINIKKEGVNTFVTVPHKIKDKKVCAFLDKKSNLVDTITKDEFKDYKDDKKKLRKLAKNYDFFISLASLMPSVASTFGKFLGPAGKMPSPNLGILKDNKDETIKETLDRINKTVRIKAKEPSLKIPVGKQEMGDKELAENVEEIYKNIIKELPRNKENIKKVLIKFTMSKPIKIEV
jgi:large subunit ribosomal protein L1